MNDVTQRSWLKYQINVICITITQDVKNEILAFELSFSRFLKTQTKP